MMLALGEFAGSFRAIGKKGSRPPVHESIALAIGYIDSLPQPPSPGIRDLPSLLGEVVRKEDVGDGKRSHALTEASNVPAGAATPAMTSAPAAPVAPPPAPATEASP